MSDVRPEPAIPADEQVFFDTLDARGEAAVIADLESRRWGGRERDVRKWLALKQRERDEEAAQLARRNTAATESAAEAASRSATAAEGSAQHAKSSARHAMIAWIVAAIAAAISLLALFKK